MDMTDLARTVGADVLNPADQLLVTGVLGRQRRALAKAVGITPDGVKYHLQKLTKAGVIRHVGATRSGKWVICK